MMSLQYVPVEFKLQFKSQVDFHRNPPLPFVLRSVLGFNLRSMCCISRLNQCSECMYNKTCAYSFIFETILPQKNNLNPGTNRASHPFSFTEYSNEYDTNESSFTITLFGKAVDFLPYIYAAFFRAGKIGLFKERIPYIINDVCVNGTSILIDENNLDMGFERFLWKFENEADKNLKKEILIELKTPLRFKINGKYTKNFTALDFMNCLYRRMKTCCQLYGKFENDQKYTSNSEIAVTDAKLKWLDKTHYSSRQKNSMELGGITGSFKIIGTFSRFDLALLDFAQKFNAGKNTNFGLGILDYWERNV